MSIKKPGVYINKKTAPPAYESEGAPLDGVFTSPECGIVIKNHNQLDGLSDSECHPASAIYVDAAFTKILSLTDDDVQKALATLDAHDHNASDIEVQGTYGSFPSSPGDLESIIGDINNLLIGVNVNNWIANGDAESSTVGWNRYADDNMSGNRFIPYDGSGGSPSANVTWERSTVDPITGNGSFVLTKDAADRQGEGAAYDFNAPKFASAQINIISFDYMINSGSYANNYVRVFVYDKVNNIIITPQFNSGISISNGQFVGYFIGNANSGQYRLIFHISSNTASAFSLKIDNIRVFSDEGFFRFPNGSARSESNFSGHSNPADMAYRPTVDRLYVANRGNDTVRTVNPQDGSITATITVGDQPYGIVYCPSNDRVYVANYNSGTISKIYGTTVEATIPVGVQPFGLVYCPSNDKIYFANGGSDTVGVLDPYTDTIDTNISVGTTPRWLAYCPINDRVYVANLGGSSITIIRPSTNTVVGTIVTSESPYGLTYCEMNNKLYVCHTSGAIGVSVIDPETNSIIATISDGFNPYFIAYNPTNHKLYTANYTTNNVTIIDVFTNEIFSTVAVGTGPYGVVYCTVNNKIAVSNFGSGYISNLSYF